MKRKTLLFLGIFLTNAFMFAQFSSGVVTLGATGMTLKLDTSPTQITITLTGNTTSSYLGIGFGSSPGGMAAGSDGFIYNKASTSNTNLDYTFNGKGVIPTADTSQDWTVTSATGVGTSSTTIVATRSLTGSSGDQILTNASGSIDIFFARGPSSVTTPLAYHGSSNRGYATLNMATLGTTETELKKITISPNPTNGLINFTNANKIKALAVYDASGRLIITPKLDNNNSIDISTLKNGIYYIEIENTNSQKSFEKVIKK